MLRKIFEINEFFQPYYRHITISAEVAARKPKKEIFEHAIKLIKGDLPIENPFENVLFITEEPSHINAARPYNMKAIHFKGPEEDSDAIDNISDLIEIVQNFINGQHP